MNSPRFVLAYPFSIPLLSFVLLISTTGALADDVLFSEKIPLTGLTDGTICVLGSDLDGDGDLDAISASRHDEKIAWYENLDGLGNFGPQNIISNSVDDVQTIHSVDLDHDGDNDVLSASWGDDKVAWYENIDGLGTFGPQLIISDSVSNAYFVNTGDIDGDNDLDVLFASSWLEGIGWFANIDGTGEFGQRNTIEADGLSAKSVVCSDLDGDGDNDVLMNSSAYEDDRIAWYENIDGAGRRGPRI